MRNIPAANSYNGREPPLMNEQELAWNEMKRLYERQQYEKLLS